jgi:hypothetical protein
VVPADGPMVILSRDNSITVLLVITALALTETVHGRSAMGREA